MISEKERREIAVKHAYEQGRLLDMLRHSINSNHGFKPESCFVCENIKKELQKA